MLKSWIVKSVLVAFVAVSIFGCGDDGELDPGTATPTPDPAMVTLSLKGLIAWAVPEHVTRLAVSGFDAEGRATFREEVAPSPELTVNVPATSALIEIEYFSMDEKVGVVLFDLDLEPGQTFTFAPPLDPPQPFEALRFDVLINADMWEAAPRMIAAGLGFTDIIGVPDLDPEQPEISEQLTREAGGTWNTIACPDPILDNFTSARTPDQIFSISGVAVVGGAGLPVEFSWPIRPSTLEPGDFLVTLNDGSEVVPEAATLTPNYDYNERAVAVLFGQFGNRLSPDSPDARFPIAIEVVESKTPLELVGPGGQIVSAVGMFANAPGSPYTDPDVAPEDRGGPRLVGAKISRMSAVGDGAPVFFSGAVPNDGIALYGEKAEYRLRVFTSGGFSPDGVRAVYPEEYQRYFRVHATTDGGETVLLEEAEVDYQVDGHTIRVVGLAELGLAAEVYDDCYLEDSDNQLDIILAGDEEAIRRVTGVEVPSVAPYSPFYNPGGPGNQPTPGVRYSAPSRPHLQPVLQAIDDPMTVTFIDLRGIALGTTGQ